MTKTLEKSTTRKLQLWAFGIFAVPFLINCCFRLLAIVGIPTTEWLNYESIPVFKFTTGMLGAGTTLTAYIILSCIATNRTTGILMRYVGFALFAFGVISAIFYLTFTGEGWSTIGAQAMKGALYWIPILTVFYMLGTLERNNPNSLSTKRAVSFLFWIGCILPMILVPIMLLLTAGHSVIYHSALILDASLLHFGYYLLMTSEAFSGRTDNSPAPKGAYRIWNKYFKYSLFAFLALVLITGIYTFVTGVILK